MTPSKTKQVSYVDAFIRTQNALIQELETHIYKLKTPTYELKTLTNTKTGQLCAWVGSLNVFDIFLCV